MSGIVLRPADQRDLSFLVEAIISAEKSGTAHLGLATLFGLTEEQVRPLVGAMLQEEVDGCELSVSSFLVAEVDGAPAAALAGWVEGAEDGPASGLVKANLIGATYPAEALATLRTKAPLLSGVRIDREMHTLQIEYVHVDASYRGLGLTTRLIEAQVRRAARSAAPPTKAQVQVFANNAVARRVYERSGFTTVRAFTAADPAVADLLPFHEKLLMERML